MAREILPPTHPSVVRMRYTGRLTLDDMAADSALNLNAGKPLFVLCDVTDMHTWLPDGFFEGARRSFFVNPNMQHLALVIRSPLLRTVALMVAKITERRDKISLHETVTGAETHLLTLARKQ